MIGYTWTELIWIASAAIALDWLIGDPRWIPHPVILIGKWITYLEKKLLIKKAIIFKKEKDTTETGTYVQAHRSLSTTTGTNVQNRNVSAETRTNVQNSGNEIGAGGEDDSLNRKNRERAAGVWLVVFTLGMATGVTLLAVYLAHQIHPWLGYAVSVWLVASTLAVKGLKDAAEEVWRPLQQGDLVQARTNVAMIVGRDTKRLDEQGVVRATVETVAENIVDAFVSPLFFAIIGGAPGAMLYRAANTLDSMVGYKNEKYRYFGWASARFDDVLNWIPARITGVILIIVAAVLPGLSGKRAAKSIRKFAHLHPSPNSGIPEAGAAGALGIELGGTNEYDGVVSERARMGWPLRPRVTEDILQMNRVLAAVSIVCLGGLQCVLWLAL